MKQQHYLYIPGRKTMLSLFLCLALLAASGGIALAASMPGESSAEPAETSAAVQDSSEESLPAYSITLADEGSSSDCGSVLIDGSRVTITEAGDYTVSGSLSNGQLVVGADKESRVQLRLNGVSISSASSAALYVISAERVFIVLEDGTENILSSTGSFVQTDDNNVDGAIFSKDDMTIKGSGTLNILCAEGHGIVGKDDLKIKSGEIHITSAKKGISANDTLEIADGSLSIHADTEGLEATEVIIAGGELDITAKDDGINASDGSGSNSGPFGQMGESAASSCSITISGGTVRINAEGDAIDANGSFTVSGGTVLISGPTARGNGALDYDAGGIISGGMVIAVDSSGMGLNFRTAENQGSILYTFQSVQSAGTGITLTDDSGTVIASFTPEKSFQTVVISTPEIQQGQTYTLSAGTESVEITMDTLLYGGNMGGFGGRGGMMMPQDGSNGFGRGNGGFGSMTPPEGGQNSNGNGMMTPGVEQGFDGSGFGHGGRGGFERP